MSDSIDSQPATVRRVNHLILFCMAIVVLFCSAAVVRAHELSGYAGGQARLFFQEAQFPGQRDHSASLVLRPEYYHEFESGSSVAFTPFFRLDSQDSRRTHFDVREMTYLHLADEFELRVGVRRVFWGVTEFQHLVDVINQTDLVENPDTEDKLGQPMVNLSFARDWGTLDLFWLPYFRERTFPGRGGRLRFATVLDTDNVLYESSAQEWNQDFAVRYSKVIEDLDLGLAWFHGTSRDPSFVFAFGPGGVPQGKLLYQQINQVSLDASYVADAWLLKLEALYRAGQGNRRGPQADDYAALTGGFEYTLYGLFDLGWDLGLIAEYLYDERGDDALTPFENDVGLGARLAFNDVQSTEILLGMIQDIDTPARYVSVEASRRLGSRWTLEAEARLFLDQPPSDFFVNLNRDDYVQLELQYHF